jgi:Family of unknown function (DUF5685)
LEEAMLGYVTTEKQELKMREYEIYRGYYCGVCKSIGRRYGQIPRLALSYDAAFLAMVLASLNGEPDIPTKEHCIIHPIKKNTAIRNEAIDYAADVMLILTWHKLQDDVNDEKKASSRAALLLMKPLYKKLRKSRGPLCDEIGGYLGEMSRLEKEKCNNLDQISETFAKILEAVFIAGAETTKQDTQRVLGRLGYHLGKWIYLMDAWDDLEDNIKTGAYNPLLYRYDYDGIEQVEAFRERIKSTCEWHLLVCCEEMGKALDLLEIQKNNGIIENIVYLGLLRRTEKVLGKEDKSNGESL